MTTATTLKMKDVTAFKHLSNFTTIKDFNNNMEQILLDHKKSFTKSELIGLKQLLRFCAKVKGVATARICKIVSATFADGKMGISRKTFERMLAKAIKLGIITVKNGERENGSQTSNIYVFNRYETVKKHAEQRSQQPLEDNGIVSESATIDAPKPRKLTHLKAIVLSKPLIFKFLKTRKENRVSNIINKVTFDHTFTAEYVPTDFRDFAKCYYDDAEQIEKLWKRVVIAGKKHGIDDTATLVTIGIESLKVMKRKMKHVRKDVTGYYYGILKKKMVARAETVVISEAGEAVGQATSTKSVYVYEEIEPQWFSERKRNTTQDSAPSDNFDINLERQKLLKELGQVAY